MCVCTYSSLIAANCVGVRRSWSGNDSKASVNQENRSPIIFDLMAWPILTLLRLLYLNREKVWCHQISHFDNYKEILLTFTFSLTAWPFSPTKWFFDCLDALAWTNPSVNLLLAVIIPKLLYKISNIRNKNVIFEKLSNIYHFVALSY